MAYLYFLLGMTTMFTIMSFGKLVSLSLDMRRERIQREQEAAQREREAAKRERDAREERLKREMQSLKHSLGAKLDQLESRVLADR
ncbi:MAG: hypothetical protein F4Y27_04750 [Acidimicrobiaceae bacterium]|nr:hypothetical protein [Acidimicrobiaceae bacterium]MXW63078.1 hypothetical protein [Acidimicrobiaceae bacterium]MXW76466.1 hypothetical protein [Acidimicrobiaceae bacterium]MYA73965.1 hypothetical protein [Acidimicrobiaceae bacterium]MYC43468.1 hypothetical protein [Acidimicrobiaceae bacterium]